MDVDVMVPPVAVSSAEEPRHRNWRRGTRSLAAYLVMLYVLITLNFLLPRAMPGDPIDGLLGQGAAAFPLGEESRKAMESYYGLSGSLASQYRHYPARLAHGHLGP